VGFGVVGVGLGGGGDGWGGVGGWGDVGGVWGVHGVVDGSIVFEFVQGRGVTGGPVLLLSGEVGKN